MILKFGTLCSGIGAPETAWAPLGWESVFASEIDPFASAVLHHHHPDTPNLGDMEAITNDDIRRRPVDVICGGTPCQSFSLAGLRKGMDDPRGNLALAFLRLVDAARPTWVVWENVPGVLSSNRGRDFGAFVGAMGQIGYGWAYRILDAQYFGVPQRRRRVFVVGCAGGWQRAAAVLFERHSLSGHPAPSRSSRADIAGSLTQGFGRSGADVSPAAQSNWLIAATLNSNGKAAGSATQQDAESGMLVVAHGQASAEIVRDGSPSLTCNHEAPILAHTLRGEGFDASEDGTGRGTPIIPILVQTRIGRNGRGQPKEIADTLTSSEGGTHADSKPHIAYSGGVRRLTPRECERLQGFPDDHTLIPYRGKLAKDGPRYRALGNSMAVPVMRWIGERLAAVHAMQKGGSSQKKQVTSDQ